MAAGRLLRDELPDVVQIGLGIDAGRGRRRRDVDVDAEAVFQRAQLFE